MKSSEKWLYNWVKPKVDTNDLIAQLTMAGIEVESCQPVAAHFSKVVVGKILEITPHPNADKLRICNIDVGSEILTIVTNATNVYTGLHVPVALIGATLPKNEGISNSEEYFTIQPTKLRGVDSAGMLCAAATLGLAEQSAGILELPEDAPVGADIRDYLQLDDQILEFGLTPNRGDCLSVRGMAREIAALNNSNIQQADLSPIPEKISDTFPIDLSAEKQCPRYAGRIIRQINPRAKTPLWMQECLRRSGIRSISPVVDITNYVMLELGQPMHAFDLNQLHEKIEIRLAKPQEKLMLLNQQEITLAADTLVIADAKNAVALAGIMGGSNSSVTENTTDIFLESAYFTPESVIGRGRHYNLSSDSLHRFERGVDPELQIQALERATQLLLEITDGLPGPISQSKSTLYSSSAISISLRLARVRKLLGITITETETIGILSRLNMQIEKKSADILQVTVPSYRFDLRLEIDLIEEIARLYSYDNIPACHLPALPYSLNVQETLPLSRLKALLQNRGYHEAITYSFIDPKLQQAFNPNQQAINLLNPLSIDMSVMRTSLWPGLIKAAMHNLNRQQNNFKLFETGLQFLPTSSGLQQPSVISGIVVGNALPEQWGMSARAVDFFDIKADVEALLAFTQQSASFEFQPATHPALHPGQSAQILYEGKIIGYLGALHPKLLSELDINCAVYAFELLLAPLQQVTTAKFTPIAKFPAIRRDIAIIVAQSISARSIENVIKQVAGKVLVNLAIFDIYQGKNIPSDKKSVAVGLTLQDPSRTLTEEEVTNVMENILVTLKQELAATLRE